MNYSHIRKTDKGQILGILKDIYPSAKFPSNIDVKISSDCLFINLKGKGVVANMQTDESAFEGWCIVLKAALPEIGSVILDWDSPAYIAGKENVQKAHYTRFLMRAANFRRAYSCFYVSDSRCHEVDELQSMLDNGDVVVNYPKKDCSKDTGKDKKPEAYLERKLVDLWRQECPVTDEQLPVGLFRNGVVSEAGTLTQGRARLIYDSSMAILYASMS